MNNILIIKVIENKKVVERINLSDYGPGARSIGKDIIKRHLKQGQTIRETDKMPKVQPVVAQNQTA